LEILKHAKLNFQAEHIGILFSQLGRYEKTLLKHDQDFLKLYIQNSRSCRNSFINVSTGFYT